MGEVYRALDRRLSRTVAIKVLPEHVASDSELRQRFEREAKTLAALSHPYICPVFDVGRENGIDFLVMEYLEGDTLAVRLKKGALSLDQALQVGSQIADALDTAHREGIVHRDLKPGNIMLTRSGAKLLDFGLAKFQSLGLAAGVSGASGVQTVSSPLTGSGSFLGTLQYMAPEQLEGKDVDQCADVWAFGAVLYEMMSGRRAFNGSNAASVISTILMTEPPALTTVQPLASPLLTRIVAKCLAKDPRHRWRSMADVGEMLKGIGDGTLAATTSHTPTSPWRRRHVAGAVVAAALAAASIVAGLYVWLGSAPTADVAESLTVALLPPPQSTEYGSMALSPDGRHVVLRALDAKSKTGRLWLRPLDSDVWQPLPETEGADSPAWAPDSRFVTFVADNKLRRIDVLGGPPQTIAEKASRWGASWSVDGSVVFNENGNGPLSRVSAAGGAVNAVTALEPGEVRHQEPYFLPDGRHFLYGSFPSSVYVGTLMSGERKLLLRDAGLRTVYSGGRLFFTRGGTLMAQRFDIGRLELLGDPLPVAMIQDGATFDITLNGLLAFKSGGNRQSQLQWFDRAGKSLGLMGDPANYYTVELSPDDGRVAGSILRDSDRSSFLGDVWIHDVVAKTATRLTFDATATVGRSIWSPDGRLLVFMRRGKEGVLNLFQKAANGAGDEQPLLEDNVNKYPLSWSQDGRFVLYMAVPGSPTTGSDLWVLPMFGDRKPFPFLQTRSSETAGQFSADGRWVAYYSNSSGRPEVHVASFPDSRNRRQISSDGQGGWPRWRADGKEIFWLAGDDMMSASVNGEGTHFEVGSVQTLFKVRRAGDPDSPFAVSRDGRRFLIISAVETDSPGITLMTNIEDRLDASENPDRSRPR
jgi:Tol biopolymer transport system component